MLNYHEDGVAPRAKMNQQRSRRFRAAQENRRLQEKKIALKDLWQKKGVSTSETIEQYIENSFDSNVITPGTEFMSRLSKALHVNSNKTQENLIFIFICFMYRDMSIQN